MRVSESEKERERGVRNGNGEFVSRACGASRAIIRLLAARRPAARGAVASLSRRVLLVSGLSMLLVLVCDRRGRQLLFEVLRRGVPGMHRDGHYTYNCTVAVDVDQHEVRCKNETK